jgi:hypothetical protein
MAIRVEAEAQAWAAHGLVNRMNRLIAATITERTALR